MDEGGPDGELAAPHPVFADALRVLLMAVTTHIHFEGPWPTDERERVAVAVGEVETATSDGPEGPGAPWILVRKDVGSGTFYAASRLGQGHVWTGRSAEDLAERIRGRS